MGHYAHRSVRKCRRRHRSAEEDEEEKTLNFVKKILAVLAVLCLLTAMAPAAYATGSDTSGVGYGDLRLKVATANGLNEYDYTKESWAPLAAALKTGNGILSGTYSQAEVDAAAAAIVSAMEGLVKMDYSRLEAALGAVQSRIGEAPELHDVWIRLYDAVAQGRPLLTSGDQTAVDEAVVKLNELLEELSGYGYVSTAEPEVIIQEVEVEVLPTGDFCNIPMHRTWPVLFFISAALNVGLVAALIFVILRKRNTMDDTPLVSYDIDDDMDF